VWGVAGHLGRDAGQRHVDDGRLDRAYAPVIRDVVPVFRDWIAGEAIQVFITSIYR